MTTPRVTVPVEPTPLSVCRAIAPYLGAIEQNDWSGLEDDDAISMPVKMRVGDLRDLKAVISAAPAPGGAALDALDEALIYIENLGANIERNDLDMHLDTVERPFSFAQTMRGRFPSLCTALATREEAPAEAGALVGLIDYLENMRAETLTDEGREIMSEWIEALRAQPPAREVPAVNIKCEASNGNAIGTTSLNVIRVECEDDGSLTAVTDYWPPAREDAQPVAWRGRISETSSVWDYRNFDMTGEIWSVVQPLYTHPAPDALRVAVEALEPFARAADTLDGLWSEDDWRWNDSVRCGVTVRDIRRARQALAALQAEQKGGA